MKEALCAISQFFTHVHWHYTAFFFLVNLCLYTFKGMLNSTISWYLWYSHLLIKISLSSHLLTYFLSAIFYFYPSDYLGMDLLLIFLYLICNCIRLTFGKWKWTACLECIVCLTCLFSFSRISSPFSLAGWFNGKHHVATKHHVWGLSSIPWFSRGHCFHCMHIISHYKHTCKYFLI